MNSSADLQATHIPHGLDEIRRRVGSIPIDTAPLSWPTFNGDLSAVNFLSPAASNPVKSKREVL
jgi:hypothetical protein